MAGKKNPAAQDLLPPELWAAASSCRMLDGPVPDDIVLECLKFALCRLGAGEHRYAMRFSRALLRDLTGRVPKSLSVRMVTSGSSSAWAVSWALGASRSRTMYVEVAGG